MYNHSEHLFPCTCYTNSLFTFLVFLGLSVGQIMSVVNDWQEVAHQVEEHLLIIIKIWLWVAQCTVCIENRGYVVLVWQRLSDPTWITWLGRVFASYTYDKTRLQLFLATKTCSHMKKFRWCPLQKNNWAIILFQTLCFQFVCEPVRCSVDACFSGTIFHLCHCCQAFHEKECHNFLYFIQNENLGVLYSGGHQMIQKK